VHTSARHELYQQRFVCVRETCCAARERDLSALSRGRGCCRWQGLMACLWRAVLVCTGTLHTTLQVDLQVDGGTCSISKTNAPCCDYRAGSPAEGFEGNLPVALRAALPAVHRQARRGGTTAVDNPSYFILIGGRVGEFLHLTSECCVSGTARISLNSSETECRRRRCIAPCCAVARAGVDITRTSMGVLKCRHGFRKSKPGSFRCLPCKGTTYQPKLGQSSCLTSKALRRVNAAKTACSGAAFPILLASCCSSSSGRQGDPVRARENLLFSSRMNECTLIN